MDDLARAMGVSKKTIYQFVDNKADLVDKVMQRHLELEKCDIQEIQQQADNAINEMFEIGQYVAKHLRMLNPNIINDLQKYYPKAWSRIDDFKEQHVRNVIKGNIERGIEQGYYRSDIDSEILARIYSSKMECVVDQKLFPFTEFAIIDVYREFLNHHIRGIASEKGLRYLETFNNQIDAK